jgi:hypothetical protein
MLFSRPMPRKTIPAHIATHIKDYIDVLRADRLPISKVIVFGSFPQDEHRLPHQVDVCILSPKFADSYAALDYLWAKRKTPSPHCRIAPVGFSPEDFEHNSSPFVENIKSSGIEVAV